MPSGAIRVLLFSLIYAFAILLVCVLISWAFVWPLLSIFDIPVTYFYIIAIFAYVFLVIAIALTMVKHGKEASLLPERLPVKEVVEGVAKTCPHCGTLVPQKSTNCPKCGAPLES